MIIHKSLNCKNSISVGKHKKYDIVLYFDEILFGWEIFCSQIINNYSSDYKNLFVKQLVQLQESGSCKILFISTYKHNINRIKVVESVNNNWLVNRLLESILPDMKIYTVHESLKKLGYI